MTNSRPYETTRMANFGRDTAKAYGRFLKTQDRLAEEINDAVTSGIKPLKVAHDLMGRCASQEERINLLTVLSALTHLEKIPAGVFEPFEKGIRPRRV